MSAARLERRTFVPGDRLFHEGEPGDTLYLVKSGRVEISKRVPDDEVVIALVGPNEMVGEMALVDDQPRHATARAVQPTEVIAVSREAFQKRLDGADPVLRNILQILIQRLRAQVDETVARTTVIR